MEMMKLRFARWGKAVVLFLALFSLTPGARACAICYGEPDSPMSQGLTWAIVALGVIVVAVLSGIVGFFVHSNRKATELSETGDDSLSRTQL